MHAHAVDRRRRRARARHRRTRVASSRRARACASRSPPLGETNAEGKLLYPQLQETREQIGVPSRFDQTREATRNAIADEYNGDRKILTAIRSAAFVINVFQQQFWDTVLPSNIIKRLKDEGDEGRMTVTFSD